MSELNRRLAEIEERLEYANFWTEGDQVDALLETDVPWLIAEVRRLTAELERKPR